MCEEILRIFIYFTSSHQWLNGKESACNAGDQGLIPGLGRSPGGGHGNPLQYSCLDNPMDRGAWWATAHGVARVRHDLATKPPPLIHATTWMIFENIMLSERS